MGEWLTLTTDQTLQLLGLSVFVLISVVFYFTWWKRERRRRHPKPRPSPQPTPTPAPRPVPGGLPPCKAPPEREGNVLKGVYSPDRLQILSDCSIAKGIVAEVKHEHDGDVHIRLSPVDPDSPAQPMQGQDFLICEIIPMDQSKVQEPQVGQHIACYGPNVHDKIHNWDEIHPIWTLLVL